ncbi:SAUR auxin-responsive family protein [Hibiscus syriacus]|uniref:SAUR auxin-responsive family protein n=1 Tax=Hibiscus syriacus TaxID=106335 RepID=A0A6A3C9W4_HIBSY|nr:SAUR auxin-responsive family protein [Hibiscus syriacus]
MIISSKKLNRMTRKWHKMIVKGRKRFSLLGTSNAKVIAGGIDEPLVAEKGHFVIYTTDLKRYVVPLSYLSNNIFVELLKLSEEEFGLSSHVPMMLPCDSAVFKYIVSIVQQGMGRHLEKALRSSIFPIGTPFAPLSIRDRHANSSLFVDTGTTYTIEM